MKITIIGTLNKDLILPFNGTPIEGYGGIFYNVSVLSHLMKETDQIIPVSYIGEDIEGPINALLKKLPNVSKSGFISLPQKNHRVILEYVSPNDRKEKAVFNFPPLKWENIEPFLDSDFIMINMITGWDIEKDTFQKISEKVRDKLYFDLHFLVMGVDKLGKRFPQKPDNLEFWLNKSRFVQMNQKEYDVVNEDSLEDLEFHQRYLDPDQILIITMGGRGSKIIYRIGMNTKIVFFEAPKLNEIIDATGCGDTYGSGFIHEYLNSGNVENAGEFASLLGSAKALLLGTREMYNLTEVVDILKNKRN